MNQFDKAKVAGARSTNTKASNIGGHNPFEAPRYPILRATPLTDAAKAEFSAQTVPELVDRLNAILRRQGRRPLPQGGFPTRTKALPSFLRLLREAMAESKKH